MEFIKKCAVSVCIFPISQDHNGTTPLHKAATLGYAKCMKLLLEAKADIHSKVSVVHIMAGSLVNNNT